MPSINYPPALAFSSWERQTKTLKKTKPLADLGEALKALAKRHDGITFDSIDAGKSQVAADIERRPALIDAEMKKVSAAADAAKALELQAKKVEAELKKDKQPPEAAVAVAKAALAYAAELGKLAFVATAAKAELAKRAAALKVPDKKPAGKDADSAERKLVRARVVAGMRAVKTAQPTAKPIQFLICLGTTQCLAYLGHSVGASHRTLLTELMEGDSGFKFYKGECLWEAKAYTFVGSNVPSGLAKKLQKGLLELTKNRYKIRIRKDTGEVEEVDGDDVPDSAAAGADLAAFEADDAAAADPALAALSQRLDSLTAKLDALQAFDGSFGKEVKTRVDAVAHALTGGKADAAAKLLDAVDQITKVLTAKQAAAPAAADGPAKALAERLKQLVEQLQRDGALDGPLAKEVKARVDAANQAVKAGDADAVKKVDVLEQMAKVVAAKKAGAVKKPASIVQLQKSRLAYDGLRNSVQGQLQDLEQSILAAVRAHNGDETREDEFDEADVVASVKQVYSLLDRLDARLIDKLDEALNAKEEALRASRHAEAAGIIKEYQAFVNSDPMLKEIDDNGFTKTTIRASVVKTLDELAAQF